MFFATQATASTAAQPSTPDALPTERLALPSARWPVQFDAAHSGVLFKGERLLPNELFLGGRVAQVQTLSLAEVLQLPQSFRTERVASQQGWSFKSEWQGIQFNTLAQKVKAAKQATWLRVEGSNTACYVPLAELNEAVLLLREGGQPLSPWHGGPLRLLRFDWPWEALPAQVHNLQWLSDDDLKAEAKTEATPVEKLPVEATVLKPGRYYAYDLKQLKTVERPHDFKTF